jgi:hypothetical protein
LIYNSHHFQKLRITEYPSPTKRRKGSGLALLPD